jgi:predicted transcriptional regulator YheO
MSTLAKTFVAVFPRAANSPSMPLSASARQAENARLIAEAKKIVVAIGKMFAPCCEVVLHDLQRPEHSIIHIECPLSGRKVGDSGTELVLARIRDQNFPDIVQNYTNSFPDGRPVKSTSIGVRNSEGKYIAAICLNLDLSLFSSMNRVIGQFISTDAFQAPIRETLRARSLNDVRQAIENFAAQRNTQPRALSSAQRKELIRLLGQVGLLQLRGAAPLAAEIIGISRASIYNALKEGA